MGQKVHGVFGPTILLLVALLATKPSYFSHRHAQNADLAERILHLFQLEVAYDGFDLFQLNAP